MKVFRILLGILLISGISHAASDNTIRITVTDYPPFTGPTLENNGVLCEIIKEAFAHEKINVEYSFFPEARALKLAEKIWEI